MEIDLLDPDQSLQLLVQEAERAPDGVEEYKAAAKIVDQLGRLPLALEMAGAYLRHRRLLTWGQYLEMLNSNLRAALRPDLLASFTQHEQDLFATLKIQEEVLHDEPLLGEILDVLTWSSPSSMGLSLLGTILQADEILLRSALALGSKLRIVDNEAGSSRFSLHRLISRVRREEFPLEQRNDWTEVVCRRLGDWFEARRQNFADLPQFEVEIDHLRVWQEHAAKLSSHETGRLIWLEAYPSFHRGLYQESRNKILEAISIFRGSEPKLEAWLWNDLGATAAHLGDLGKALEYSHKALAVYLSAFSEEDPAAAMFLDNIGANYRNLGQHKEALEFVFRGLEIRRRVLGEQHQDTARSFDNIGTLHAGHDEYEKALEFKLKALEIRKSVLGDRHPDTAVSLDSVSAVYDVLAKYESALELALQALDIRRNLLGEQHPHTADSYDSVGASYSRLGHFGKALEYRVRGLEIRRQALGDQHPETAISFNSVGISLSKLQQYQESLNYLRKAFEIRVRVLGEQHPDSTQSAVNIAQSLLAMDRRQEAFALIEPYLQKLPAHHSLRPKFEKLRREILAKPLRRGFRQPSSKRKGPKRR